MAGEPVGYYLGGAMGPIAPPRRDTHLSHGRGEKPWAIIMHMPQGSGYRPGEPTCLELFRCTPTSHPDDGCFRRNEPQRELPTLPYNAGYYFVDSGAAADSGAIILLKKSDEASGLRGHVT